MVGIDAVQMLMYLSSQLFYKPAMNVAAGPMLYYLHPDVSLFKGSGFKQLGPYIDMPDNSASGDVSKTFVAQT
jgi:hypothetical protein